MIKYILEYNNYKYSIKAILQPPKSDVKLAKNIDLEEKELEIVELDDINRYSEKTRNGELWKYLMKKCEIEDKDREKFKKELFEKIFYGRITNKMSSERRIFEEEFPMVMMIIDYFKKSKEKKLLDGENDEAFKELARTMQKKESDIMINTIAKRLVKENIFIVTIHDSIMCLEKDAKHIKEVIEEEFNKKHKIIPKINRKDKQ